MSGVPSEKGALPQPAILSKKSISKKSAAPANSGKGRKSGSVNWRDFEMEVLFTILENIVPVGTNEWKACENPYNINEFVVSNGLNIVFIKFCYTNSKKN